MDTARLGSPKGKEVTPEEFMRLATPNYKENGVFPYCKACHQVVDVYGVHSPNVPSRFDHKNLPAGADPLDDCILANRNPRFKGMQPESFDDEHGLNLRKQFFEKENIKNAYSFMLHVCGKGNFPVSSFKKCIIRADNKNIWSYKDIPLWVIPYILLTLENFTTQKYPFHFIIKKPHNTYIDELWKNQKKCTLCKVFSDSGMLVKTKVTKNPLTFSQQNVLEIVGSTSWIDDNLVYCLQN